MTARDNVNDVISSAGFVPRSNTTIGRPPSRNSGGKQELKEDDLIVRVRERSTTTTNSEERPRTRLGSFLSRRGGGGSNENAALQSIANEFKEQLKRPLSSLFRRTQSNDRSQQQSGGIKQTNINLQQQTNITQQHQQQSSFINNKTNRIPSAVGGRSTTLITGMGTTDNNNNNESTTIGINNNISTTAIRPFTGINKREIIKQQNDEINKLEIDLSEQAAIAPSMRRFSGFSATDPSSSLFIMKQQKQKRQQQINKGNNIENKEEIEDVNFLSRFLCPEDEIQDENIPWTWDSLFASVTSELREEWALEEEALNSEGGNNNEQIIPGGGIPTN
ncbi:hypothetical protein Mgra_00002486 [Meloidogyne graminicola]|uniref:Uncharacterized protein n=1 Tax=Meloidogyne graminicola TaxID=189291 RepID=A0A8S9ZYP3_9BILA|nr:hypothetical protein Mgra_00002486 [Meloidogyne graminicola]